MTTKKILDRSPIPGGNPDRPTRRGQGPRCSAVKCNDKPVHQGLCQYHWDDFKAEQAKKPSEDQWNEAFERAKHS